MKRFILINTMLMTSIIPIQSIANVGHWGVSGKIGTLGKGVEVIKPINRATTLRIGVNRYDTTETINLDKVNYNLDVALDTLILNVDFHPTHSGFFASIGGVINKNKITTQAMATHNNPINFGNTALTNGSISADISFDNKISPYLGVGYRTPSLKTKPGWGLSFEAGAFLQETINVKITESTGLIPQSNISIKEDSFKDELNFLKIYPVISAGIVYNF